MDLNQFTQFFDNPKVSVFNRSQLKEFPLRIGQFIPAKWDILSFGNSGKGSTGHKMRLAPMLAPNFSNMRLDEHTAIVPLRVIMDNYESVFNYATYSDDSVDGGVPNFDHDTYERLIFNILGHGHSLVGTLLDFLGYPIFTDLYNSIEFDKIYQRNVVQTAEGSTTDFVGLFEPVTWSTIFDYYHGNLMGVSGNIHYRDITAVLDENERMVDPFYAVMYNATYPGTQEYWPKFMGDIFGDRPGSFDYASIDSIVRASIFETVDSAIAYYKNFIFGQILLYFCEEFEIFRPGDTFTSLPLRAYWRVYGDWLTNGNFFNRDSFFAEYVYNLEESIVDTININADCYKYVSISNRLWDDDYFTSLLPTAKADNAIEIPANSTVLDLAKLTAMQKLVLKLSYSSRYRDVIWNVFKIKPSDARLQQSSIIHQRSHDIGIGETLQTSETSVSSVLGSFAGRGYSSGRSNGYHVFCEEPCVVMDFVSIMCRASYKDALHPLIHLHDPLDFPIPDMDVLGNTPVYADIVTGSPLDSQTVLGYGRQYQEWLYSFGTVHGEFKTSLDYWQLTRSFNEVAVINDDFLRMNDADDFDSIFSIPNAPHAFLSIYYKASVTRHVHRSVRIMI